jgi:hypothetical protein
LKLGPASIWRRGGTFTLPLGEVNLIPKNIVGQDMKGKHIIIYYILVLYFIIFFFFLGDFLGFKPRGAITFSINPCPQKSSECGYINGTVLEDVVKQVKIIPINNVMWVPQTTIQTTTSKNSDGKISLKKLWIAIADGNLYLYSRFGDVLKLVVNLNLVEISFSYEYDFRKGNLCTIFLKKCGYPDINFLTRKPTDNFSWIVAFACYQHTYLKNNQLDIKLVLKDLKKHDIRRLGTGHKRIQSPAILTKAGIVVDVVDEFSLLNQIHKIDGYVEEHIGKNKNEDLGNFIERDVDITRLSIEETKHLVSEFDADTNELFDDSSSSDNVENALVHLIGIGKRNRVN